MHKRPDTIIQRIHLYRLSVRGFTPLIPAASWSFGSRHYSCIILKQVLYYLHGRCVCFLHDSVWFSRTIVYLPARH